MDNEILIQSRDYWFKIIEMLQQNWALVDNERDGGAVVYFIDDAAGNFDRMQFTSKEEAFIALRKNGFRRYEEDIESHRFISTPKPTFRKSDHTNGPIYSSGRFWK